MSVVINNLFFVLATPPPFGKCSTVAVKFFNHASAFSDIIAFILPKTFRKISIQSRLNLKFHCIVDDDVPFNSFIKEGKVHDVPCCWEVWVKRLTDRVVVDIPNVDHLIAYNTKDCADLSVRRVGGSAGSAGSVLEGLDYSESSTYFIREVQQGVKSLMSTLDWSDVRNNTVGFRSISKAEITIKLIHRYNHFAHVRKVIVL